MTPGPTHTFSPSTDPRNRGCVKCPWSESLHPAPPEPEPITETPEQRVGRLEKALLDVVNVCLEVLAPVGVDD